MTLMTILLLLLIAGTLLGYAHRRAVLANAQAMEDIEIQLLRLAARRSAISSLGALELNYDGRHVRRAAPVAWPADDRATREQLARERDEAARQWRRLAPAAVRPVRLERAPGTRPLQPGRAA